MAEHLELVAEIPKVEKLTVQERLEYAKKRRKQQIRRWEREKDSDHGPPPRKKKLSSRPVTFQPQFMLLEAATRGDVDEVKKMIENGIDTNICNDDGLTALHQACIDGCEEIIDILLENGAHLDSIDRELWTPLHAAAACGNDDIVEYLLDQGANIVAINSDGNMAIDLVDDENEELREILHAEMEEQGFTEEKLNELKDQIEQIMLCDLKEKVKEDEDFDIDLLNEQGATMAHIAAANGYEDVLEFLLEQGASIDIADKDGWQPIHAAAVWGNEVTVEMLVENGADLDAKTNTGDTPLTLCEDPDLQQFLVDLKKKVKTNKAKSNKRKRSNSRSLSVKRTSLKDKITISQNEAKAEAILRVHPQLAFLLPKNSELRKDEAKLTNPAATEGESTQNITTANTNRPESSSTTEKSSEINNMNENGITSQNTSKESQVTDLPEDKLKTQETTAIEEQKSAYKIVIKTRKTSTDEKPTAKPDVTMGIQGNKHVNKQPQKQEPKPDVTDGTQHYHSNHTHEHTKPPQPDVTMVTKPSTLPRNVSSFKQDVSSGIGSRSSSDANIAAARSNRTPGQKASAPGSSASDSTSLRNLTGSKDSDVGKPPKSIKAHHAPAPPGLSKSSGSLSRSHEPADTSGYPDSFSKRSRSSRENILDLVAEGRLGTPEQNAVSPNEVKPSIDQNKENHDSNQQTELNKQQFNQTINTTNHNQTNQEENNSQSIPLRHKKTKQQEQPRESYRRRSSSENLATPVTNLHVKDDKEQVKKACCILM